MSEGRVKKDVLNELEKTVIKHDGEIKVLDNRVTNLENVSLRLENTLLREGQETRKVLEKVIAHTQQMEKIKLAFFIKTLSAGGILYIVIQMLVNSI